jgi:CheY-like chemotaxis protein
MKEKMFTPVKNGKQKIGILLDRNNIASTKNIARYLIAMGIDKKQIQTLQNAETLPEEITHLISFQEKTTEKIQQNSKAKNIPILIVEEKFLSLLDQINHYGRIIPMYGYYANELYEFIKGNQPLRILVADDDRINIELIKAILAEEFCHIDTVSDGKAALDILTEHADQGIPYQVIYLDKHMPILSGTEVISTYRTYENKNHIPRLFAVSISGDGKPEESNEPLFDMHVGKPFNKKAIKETLSLVKELFS